MDVVVALAAAVIGGLVLKQLNVPGGLIIGAMLGAAIVTAGANLDADLPAPVEGAAFIGVGAAIGVLVTRDTLGAARSALVPGLIAAVLIIAAGLAIAFLLRSVGMAPPSEFLATSPGGISAIAAIAAEQKTGAVEVAVFHLIRVVLVLVSIPALIHFLARPSP
ncbi:MAG: AbrB family transcriptional regulator [Gaiellaceae bacterium]